MNYQMTYNTATGRWEKSFEMSAGATLTYFITYEQDGLAYDSEWMTYGSTTESGSGSGESGGTGTETEGYGVTISGNTATIWYEPSETTKWVDVHYILNDGGQQNFRMTYEESTGRWIQTVAVSGSATFRYFFTYEKNDLACDTDWYTFAN